MDHCGELSAYLLYKHTLIQFWFNGPAYLQSCQVPRQGVGKLFGVEGQWALGEPAVGQKGKFYTKN